MGLSDFTSRIPFDPVGRLSDAAFEVKVLTEAGILAPVRPDKLARMVAKYAKWGTSAAAGAVLTAINHPDDTAVVDEKGSLTFEEIDRRSNAFAHALERRGVGPGEGVGIMCRNHRGFIDATLGAAKLGASSLYLNTAFAGPQLAEVVEREGPQALIYDEEFTELLECVDERLSRVVAWSEERTARPRARSDRIPRG